MEISRFWPNRTTKRALLAGNPFVGLALSFATMKAIVLGVICLAPFALAEVGDTCTYSGLKGTCMSTSGCDSGMS